jgi:hypothetical protein
MIQKISKLLTLQFVRLSLNEIRVIYREIDKIIEGVMERYIIDK